MLLHEIGHTFGADHDGDQDTIMNASYSHRAGSFSARAREVMLRTVDGRLGRGSSTGESRETTVTAEPAPKLSGSSGPLVFHITPSGQMEHDGKVVDKVVLDNLLEEAFARNRYTEISVRMSRRALEAALNPIIDAATAVGLRVTISTY